MDNEEIKLGLFADNLTGFVRNNHSLTQFLDVVERFGKCSGLKLNEEKTEMLLLGNCAQTTALNCIKCLKNRSRYLECILHTINGKKKS